MGKIAGITVQVSSGLELLMKTVSFRGGPLWNCGGPLWNRGGPLWNRVPIITVSVRQGTLGCFKSISEVS